MCWEILVKILYYARIVLDYKTKINLSHAILNVFLSLQISNVLKVIRKKKVRKSKYLKSLAVKR
jgi:hypothetical protein